MDMKKTENKFRITSSGMLIALCWLVYTISYIAKLNYAASINQVMSYYSVSHSEAGLVSTFFFFSYGIGQVINGFFCKRYNIKFAVLLSLSIAVASNIGIALIPAFEPVKYLWAANGFALSILWPCLIRLLSERLDERLMGRASVIMGTTTATGTFFTYGLCALLASIADFKLVFYIASATIAVAAVIWMIFYPSGSPAAEAVSKESCPEDKESGTARSGAMLAIYATVAALALIGIATNFVKDGLTTWVPSILKEGFGIDDSLSILLTLFLPVLSIFGNLFAVTLHNKIPDFVLQCGAVFFAAAVCIIAAIATLGIDSFIPLLTLFAIVCFLVGSCNSLITSIFPLFMKKHLNSGLIAGVLNGFCYIGSTISAWGIGAIADSQGWEGVFRLLFSVCCAVVLLAVGFGIAKLIAKRKKI